MVTVIYSWSLSNYLREGKDEGFDWFGLNRFVGGPEGGPGGPIDARDRFFWRLIVWHCWPHWFLWYANLGFWVWFDAPRICDFVCFTLSLHILLLWDQNFFIFRIFFIRVLIAEGFPLRGVLFSIERVVRLLSYQRTPSFLTHIWIQKILCQKIMISHHP